VNVVMCVGMCCVCPLLILSIVISSYLC
jgi:hypothetical protein